MQVGEQRLAAAHPRVLGLAIGSLTLSSRSASAQTSSAVADELCAGGLEVGVGDRRALAGARLDRAPRGRGGSVRRRRTG